MKNNLFIVIFTLFANILFVNMKLCCNNEKQFLLNYRIGNILHKKVLYNQIKLLFEENKNTYDKDIYAYLPDNGDSISYKIIDTLRDIKIENSLIISIYLPSNISRSKNYDNISEISSTVSFYTKPYSKYITKPFTRTYNNYFFDNATFSYQNGFSLGYVSSHKSYNGNNNISPTDVLVISYDTTLSENIEEKDWIKKVRFLSGELLELADFKLVEDYIYSDSMIIDYLYIRYRTKVYEKKSIKSIGDGIYELLSKDLYIFDENHHYYKENIGYIKDEIKYPTSKFYVIVKIKDGKLIFIE